VMTEERLHGLCVLAPSLTNCPRVNSWT
jgi:hypothetical protein